MTTDKPARKTPVRYSEKQVQIFLKEFEESDLTTSEFATKINVLPITFQRWITKHQKSSRTKKKKTNHRGPYSFEERKQAVEAFLASAMSYKDFAKTWGCSSKALSLWVQVFEQQGAKGLESVTLSTDTPKKRGAKEISHHLMNQIVETKTENESFGIRKIKNFLMRFRGVNVSTKTISKTLKNNDIPLCEVKKKKRRSSDRVRTFERALPMQLWQTDITSYVLARQGKRVYFTVYMDDCSRYIVAWDLQLIQNSDFVVNTLLNGIQRFGKPQELLTDQGRQFFSWRGKSKFQKLLDSEGIKHVVARSHHPQTVGKCERFWETVSKEFWERAKPQDLDDAKRRLAHFIDHYNHFRPHQGLDGMIPADRFFGVESEVRKHIEQSIEQNTLRLAIDEAPRSPVFLIGQIGDTPVSMHGESGSLILQTPDGVTQHLSYDGFGHHLAQGVENGRESNRNGESDETKEKTQEVIDPTAPTVTDQVDLELGERGGEDIGPSTSSGVDGILDGTDQQNRNCQETRDTDPSRVAVVTASDCRNVSGITQTTKSEEENVGNEFRNRPKEIDEENSGTGENSSGSGSFNCSSQNDAGMSRREHTDGGTIGGGEERCQDDIGQNSEEQWQKTFWKKDKEGM